MAEKITRSESARLRELAQEAWECELNSELLTLFETFCRWADNGMSAFELVEQIHEFHDGVSRDLYKRYMALPARTAVAMAIAHGLMSEDAVAPELLAKMTDEIESFRKSVDRADDSSEIPARGSRTDS